MLQVSVTLKNPSPLAGFEPANLSSNGKEANPYTTVDEDLHPKQSSLLKVYHLQKIVLGNVIDHYINSEILEACVPDTPGSNLCIRHSTTTTTTITTTTTTTTPTTTNIIIISSGYTILVRNLATSHRRFRNRVKTLTMTPLDE
jgi:hypothetical protein